VLEALSPVDHRVALLEREAGSEREGLVLGEPGPPRNPLRIIFPWSALPAELGLALDVDEARPCRRDGGR